MNILLRKNEVLASQGFKKSTLHKQINEGVFPPPVSIGPRAVAWPSNEVEQITNARIAGKSPEQLKVLVEDLVAKRQMEVA